MIASPSLARARSLRPNRTLRERATTLGIGAAVLGLLGWAWHDTGASIPQLVDGIGNTYRLIVRALPPNWSVLGNAVHGSILTFDTAFLGTAAALVFSLLLTPLAARNIAPHRVVYEVARVVIGVLRAVPEFVFALIFLVAVGISPYSIVLAIGAHTIGVLGKLFAEAVEDMDMGPVDALRASGAGRIQVFVHAILPAIAATFTGLALYRLDTNVRSALYLGAFGGGGLGFQLFNSMELFQYKSATTQLLVLLVLLLIVERASLLLRQRIL
ncbi:MAG: phosphonate ABC transporter, permease protein PhnE [Actinobacteria bacterium]|nr:phosphonate ABC transporter, permease protein PhnE [Actinomycetota bacterium]